MDPTGCQQDAARPKENAEAGNLCDGHQAGKLQSWSARQLESHTHRSPCRLSNQARVPDTGLQESGSGRFRRHDT